MKIIVSAFTIIFFMWFIQADRELSEKQHLIALKSTNWKTCISIDHPVIHNSCLLVLSQKKASECENLIDTSNYKSCKDELSKIVEAQHDGATSRYTLYVVKVILFFVSLVNLTYVFIRFMFDNGHRLINMIDYIGLPGRIKEEFQNFEFHKRQKHCMILGVITTILYQFIF